MKIVNRKTFLDLPNGTLFSKFAPDYFEDLCIKDETWFHDREDAAHDFLYQSLNDAVKCNSSDDFSYQLDLAREQGQSIPLDLDCASRDGLFDKDQLFAVWERTDVEQLLARLQTALNDGYVKQVETVGDPVTSGWYPTLHTWDASEGVFPGARYWTGTAWQTDSKATFVHWPIRFDTEQEARQYAEERDPDR